LWQHQTLYAPFDFTIQKSMNEVSEEEDKIRTEQPRYYRFNTLIFEKVKLEYSLKFQQFFSDENQNQNLYTFGEDLMHEIYQNGLLSLNFESEIKDLYLIIDNEERFLSFDQIFRLENLDDFISKKTNESVYRKYKNQYYSLFFEIIEPNVFIDDEFTNQSIEKALSLISPTRDFIKKGSLVIAQGEMVEGENFLKLQSLRSEYLSMEVSENQKITIIFGYSILVGIIFLMLILFIKNYRLSIYESNKDLTFIFLNVLILITVLIITLKFKNNYFYAVPLCILPLILKTFFDARLGLFTHVLTVLLMGFIVPNGFEFIFIQIIAGIVIIQTNTDLHKRASIFISVAQIVIIYLLSYFSFSITHEGNLNSLNFNIISFFLLNGMLTLFVQPLIYVYEKLFGLVSDITLLEFSDTNSILLKELSEKAPGTFNHSLQVANLAEAAANEIGANSLLVRVGSLYHDIGKMKSPSYYSENQKSNVSPHEDLTPKKSAEIIIDHVSEGIFIAKKNNLPDRVIDFIRTHHGTTNVYFFLKKEIELRGEDNVNKEDFKYPGPLPFSKETAILMMADSVEAASKSLRTPNYEKINKFVNQLIDKQMISGQFKFSNITLMEIELVKKILIKKLVNIYHLRIEYPK
jgi:putative nucleotidyltransferase with HDIG domain